MFNANFPFRTPPTGREPNLPGDMYGRLTLVEEVAGQSCRPSMCKWAVVCECGEVRQVRLDGLRSGLTTSCGCYALEVRATNGRASATHGLTKHQLYYAYKQMLQRCHNPKSGKFATYGGRGITVCERWLSVENFIADMAPSHRPGLTLEREDNALGYSPQNCVWATKIVQARNKRNNRLIAYQGKNICLAEACELTGLPYARVLARLDKCGWSIPRALESEDFQEPLLESAQNPEPLCLNP